MIEHSVTMKVSKFIAKDLVFDLLYWPIWWYSQGFFEVFNNFIETISSGVESTGLLIWVKNIFVPMYGDVSWQGRIVSFFMRLVQIVIRFIILCGWIIFGLLKLIAWLTVPLFILYQILFNLNLVPGII